MFSKGFNQVKINLTLKNIIHKYEKLLETIISVINTEKLSVKNIENFGNNNKVLSDFLRIKC